MSRLLRALVPALSLLVFSALAAAQVADTEPNNTCQTAQDVEGGLPIVVLGSLDSEPESPDVDFFRFAGAPGEAVQIDLEGAQTGMGTLTDPFLGFFNSACELQAISDDFGGTLNSRLNITVPDDGIFIMGASQCCDSEFLGGGFGSYTLTVATPALIDSITGTVVDEGTSLPLADVYAELDGCNAYDCWTWVASQFTGPDGSFIFETDAIGGPLPAGSYAIRLQTNGYNDAFVGPFDVAEDEALDLGAVPMTRIEYIGTVTGRVVDAVSGAPLPGNSPPFAVVELQRCENGGCSLLWYQPPDEQGYFRFDGPGFFLTPGFYWVVATAEDYSVAESNIVFIGDGEDVDFGNFSLMPSPIGFADITGCEILPMGGTCDFSVQITNRGPGRYHGEAWATARYLSLDPPYRATRFQIGRMGADNPNPQPVNLSQGRQTVLTFRLEVPATAAEGCNVCVTANVGRDPSPQFDAAGERLLFCAAVQPDGNMTRLSGKASHRLLREQEKALK